MALYEQDAMKRVIARLIKERDEVKTALSSIQATTNTTALANETSMEVDPAVGEMMEGIESTPLSPEDAFNAAAAGALDTLSKSRKKRKPPPSLPNAERVSSYKLLHSFPSMHSSAHPGITSMSVHGNLLATGGIDKLLHVINLEDGMIKATMKGHQKRVNDVVWLGEAVVSASADKCVRLWRPKDDGYKCVHIFKDHTQDVVAVDVHPMAKYFVSASKIGTLAIHDGEVARTVLTMKDEETSHVNTICRFHPDGGIIACGTGVQHHPGMVRVWDVRSRSVVATFTDNIQSAISSLVFSNNGYHLASADGSQVLLWDLRKLSNFHTLNADTETGVHCLAWDDSGSYLMGGGSDVRVWNAAKGAGWEQLAQFDDATDVVTGIGVVEGDTGMAAVVSVGMDRCVRVYGAEH